MVNFVFILMLLFHIIDDFVLQPICLSKLKQRAYWENLSQKDLGVPLDSTKYKHDYIVGLIMHALSWSIMIMLPIIFLCPEHAEHGCVWVFVIANAIVHGIVDHAKANLNKLNLVEDQTLHFIQLVATYLIIF